MKLGLAIVAALALSACISIDASGKYKALKPGASRVEVMKAMDGCPGTDLKRGRYEAMTYPGKMPFFFQLAPATYTFVFKDSALVAFGEGTAVEGGTPQEPTITFNPAKKVADADHSAATLQAAAGATAGCSGMPAG